MFKRPDPPSKPGKTPIATWVDGYYFCPDHAPDAVLLGVDVAPCYDEREIPGSEGCHAGCGRFQLAPMRPVTGKGDCRHCGCFGEDPCSNPGLQAELAAAKGQAGRKRKASAS